MTKFADGGGWAGGGANYSSSKMLKKQKVITHPLEQLHATPTMLAIYRRENLT